MLRFWSGMAIGLCTTAAIAQPGSMGSWLVDLGRDYPLTPQSGLSDADGMLTLLFMQAAARVEPDLAVAYFWQHNLLDALGRDAEAWPALAAYLKRQPDDAAAELDGIRSAIALLQTAETRAEFCRSYLGRDHLPAPAISDLHARLAEYHLNRAEPDRARSEAQAALKASEFNLRARQVLATINGTVDTPLSRIEQYLWVLRTNPSDVGAAEAVGQALAQIGLPNEADTWYQHAIKQARAVPPGLPSVDLLLARAQVLIDAGRDPEAQLLITEASLREPENVAGQLVQAHLARRKGDLAATKAAVDTITSQWQARMSSSAGGLDNRTIAEFAWVLIHDLHDVQQAAALARPLIDDPAARIVARRALGAALARAQQWREAASALEPVADLDTWAAIFLAQAVYNMGDAPAAARRVTALSTQPADAEQQSDLAQLSKVLRVPVATTRPAQTAAVALLRDFPQAVLDFPSNPDKYLAASWSIAPAGPQPGQPWQCTLELKNIGTFPITIGPDAMLAPSILCAISTQGDANRSSGPVLRMILRGPLLLKPGESLRVTDNLLVGTIRAAMIATPQITQKVELSALTNPLQLRDKEGHDVWAPAPGGLIIKPFSFTRIGTLAVPEEVTRWIAQSQSAQVDARISATTILAMFLAERQHLNAGRLSYSVPKIDPARVQAAVLARAADADWRVRARVAEMVRWFVLDKQATQTVTSLLVDPHWLVRGLTARALADHYPDTFKDVLDKLSKTDPDDWVRRLSRALLDRPPRPATSRPSAQPSPSPTEPISKAPEAPRELPTEHQLLALPDEPRFAPEPGR